MCVWGGQVRSNQHPPAAAKKFISSSSAPAAPFLHGLGAWRGPCYNPNVMNYMRAVLACLCRVATSAFEGALIDMSGADMVAGLSRGLQVVTPTLARLGRRRILKS